MDINTLTIANENDAWALLKETLQEGMPEGPFKLDFENWPILQIKLTGENFESSLTTQVMKGLLELQANFNRAYMQLRYGEGTTKRLTDEEKKSLEIVFKIQPGSSDILVKFEAAMKTIFVEALKNMTGTQAVITVLGLGMMVASPVVINDYLENQREIKEIEATSFISQQETRRMEIFADAMTRNEELRAIKDDTDETYNTILRSSKSAETVKLGNTELDQVMAQDLVRPTRDRAIETQLNGLCRILTVNSSLESGFKVEVEFEDGRRFWAALEEGILLTREKNKQLIQTAEWGKTPIYLMMNCRDLRGDISKATIVDVRDPSEISL
jgi:hypothetical protein